MRADYPTPEQVSGLRDLWKTAFGDSDAFLDCFFDTAFAYDRCRCIAVDGQIAAALYWFDCRCEGAPMAYLYAVATAPAFRGKGLCRRLMADTHDHLRGLGYAGSILVPGESGLFAMYEKMGYSCFSGMDILHAEAADPIPLREVSPEEYGALRRDLLPERGIWQEGLPFLATYAGLYAGDGFILAADCGGETVQGLELLGAVSAVPGILAALGKGKGQFRVPGTEAFAMYHPLTDVPAPGYFGLAFD